VGDTVAVGLPDTIWFPEDGLDALPQDCLSMLLFPVDRPELFDAVVMAPDGRVEAVEVKQAAPRSRWIWGAFKMPGAVLADLFLLWCERDRCDEYLGTLLNAYIAAGGEVRGIPAGQGYVDVGTLDGYRQALRLLDAAQMPVAAARPAAAGP
jgi:hypothetical protein